MQIIVGHLFEANALSLLQLLQILPFFNQVSSNFADKILHSVVLLMHLLDLKIHLVILLLELALLV